MSYRTSDDVTPEQVGKGCLVLIGFFAIVALILAFLAPPVVHPLAVSLWAHWIGWTIIAIIVAGGIMAALGMRVIGITVAVVFFLIWVIAGFFGDAWKHEAFLEQNLAEHISAEPETTGFRFLPLEVAETTAANKSTDSQVTPGPVEPLIDGSEAQWIAPMIPNNTNTRWFGKQPGDLIINTTADTTRENTEFAPGYELCCFDGDSIGWSSVNKDFWADYSPESYMTKLNDETVIVQPYLTYEFNWSHLLPVMVQQWGGNLIIRSDGSIEDVPANEASSKYPGARLYPHELAEYFAHSYQYKNGIWNYMFTHKDMPDIPQIGYKGSNQFPFLIPTDSGPEWYTAVEPYGSSKSAYMSYYINATDGSIKVYKFEEPLVGPDRAETFVNNAFNTLKGTYFYEPRPMVKNGHFYWMLSASASGTPDVQFTALVDAYSEDVIKLSNKTQVERVVAGEDPHKVGEVIGASASTPTEAPEESSSSPQVSDEELARLLREAADRLEENR